MYDCMNDEGLHVHYCRSVDADEHVEETWESWTQWRSRELRPVSALWSLDAVPPVVDHFFRLLTPPVE